MCFLACDPLLLLFWEPFRKRSADRRSLAEFCSAPATKTIRSEGETWRRPEGEELCHGVRQEGKPATRTHLVLIEHFHLPLNNNKFTSSHRKKFSS